MSKENNGVQYIEHNGKRIDYNKYLESIREDRALYEKELKDAGYGPRKRKKALEEFDRGVELISSGKMSIDSTGKYISSDDDWHNTDGKDYTGLATGRFMKVFNDKATGGDAYNTSSFAKHFLNTVFGGVEPKDDLWQSVWVNRDSLSKDNIRSRAARYSALASMLLEFKEAHLLDDFSESPFGSLEVFNNRVDALIKNLNDGVVNDNDLIAASALGINLDDYMKDNTSTASTSDGTGSLETNLMALAIEAKKLELINLGYTPELANLMISILTELLLRTNQQAIDLLLLALASQLNEELWIKYAQEHYSNRTISPYLLTLDNVNMDDLLYDDYRIAHDFSPETHLLEWLENPNGSYMGQLNRRWLANSLAYLSNHLSNTSQDKLVDIGNGDFIITDSVDFDNGTALVYNKQRNIIKKIGAGDSEVLQKALHELWKKNNPILSSTSIQWVKVGSKGFKFDEGGKTVTLEQLLAAAANGDETAKLQLALLMQTVPSEGMLLSPIFSQVQQYSGPTDIWGRPIVSEGSPLKTVDELKRDREAAYLAELAAKGRTPETQQYLDSKVNMDKWLAEDWVRLGNLANDISSIATSYVPIYGTAIAGAQGLLSVGADLAADAMDEHVTRGEMLSNLATNAGIAVLGMLPGGASKIGKVWKTTKKLLPVALSTIGGVESFSDPEVRKSFKKLLDSKQLSEITNLDWKNILTGIKMIAFMHNTGRAATLTFNNSLRESSFMPKYIRKWGEYSVGPEELQIKHRQLTRLRDLRPVGSSKGLYDDGGLEITLADGTKVKLTTELAKSITTAGRNAIKNATGEIAEKQEAIANAMQKKFESLVDQLGKINGINVLDITKTAPEIKKLNLDFLRDKTGELANATFDELIRNIDADKNIQMSVLGTAEKAKVSENELVLLKNEYALKYSEEYKKVYDKELTGKENPTVEEITEAEGTKTDAEKNAAKVKAEGDAKVEAIKAVLEKYESLQDTSEVEQAVIKSLGIDTASLPTTESGWTNLISNLKAKHSDLLEGEKINSKHWWNTENTENRLTSMSPEAEQNRDILRRVREIKESANDYETNILGLSYRRLNDIFNDVWNVRLGTGAFKRKRQKLEDLQARRYSKQYKDDLLGEPKLVLDEYNKAAEWANSEDANIKLFIQDQKLMLNKKSLSKREILEAYKKYNELYPTNTAENIEDVSLKTNRVLAPVLKIVFVDTKTSATPKTPSKFTKEQIRGQIEKLVLEKLKKDDTFKALSDADKDIVKLEEFNKGYKSAKLKKLAEEKLTEQELKRELQKLKNQETLRNLQSWLSSSEGLLLSEFVTGKGKRSIIEKGKLKKAYDETLPLLQKVLNKTESLTEEDLVILKKYLSDTSTNNLAKWTSKNKVERETAIKEIIELYKKEVKRRTSAEKRSVLNTLKRENAEKDAKIKELEDKLKSLRKPAPKPSPKPAPKPAPTPGSTSKPTSRHRKPKKEVGGKLELLRNLRNFTLPTSLKSGGIIKAAAGIRFSNGTGEGWHDNIFNTYRLYILDKLQSYGDDDTYGNDLNDMLHVHSQLYNAAGGQEGDWLNVAYESDAVKNYQGRYADNNFYGFNVGPLGAIEKAEKAGRYSFVSPRPTSGDYSSRGYVNDGMYSAITDDRRVLGRLGDWDENSDIFKLWQKDLNDRGWEMYLDPSDNYYKLKRKKKNPNDPNTPDTPDTPDNLNDPNPEGAVGKDLKNTPLGVTKKFVTKIDPAKIYTGLAPFRTYLDTKRINKLNYELGKTSPVLLKTYLENPRILGDLAQRLLYNTVGALFNHAGAETISSDATLNRLNSLANRREAAEQIIKGHIVDNEKIAKTLEAAYEASVRNMARETEVGNANNKALVNARQYNKLLLAAKNQQDYQNLVNLRKELVLKINSKNQLKKDWDLRIYQASAPDITTDPKYKLLYAEYLKTNDTVKLADIRAEIAKLQKEYLLEYLKGARNIYKVKKGGKTPAEVSLKDKELFLKSLKNSNDDTTKRLLHITKGLLKLLLNALLSK